MSSHHFVKEGQEPALLILEAINFERIEPLLEWAPLILVTDKSLDDVLKWGIKVDVVFDSENGAMTQQLLDQGPLELMKSSAKPLIDALKFLVDKKQMAVSIIAATPQEHFKDAEAFASQLKITFLDNALKWSLVTSGKFKKWFPAHSKIFIAQEKNLTFTNLRRSAEGYTVTHDGMVEICNEVFFWVAEAV